MLWNECVWENLEKIGGKKYLLLNGALKIHVSGIVNINFDFYIRLLFKDFNVIADFISEF